MSKLLKISLLLSIMLTFCLNISVFAVDDIDAQTEESIPSATQSEEALSNAESEEVPSATQNEEVSSNIQNEESYTEITSNNSSKKTSAAQVTSVKPKDEKDLSVSDILNILLIATGFVIILLAIAIFIKIK